MGFVREVQPESSEPGHCERWLGQACQGMLFIPLAGDDEGEGRLSEDALQSTSICYFRAFEL